MVRACCYGEDMLLAHVATVRACCYGEDLLLW